MALKSQQELYDNFITELQSQNAELTDTNEGSQIDVLAGVTSTAVDEVSRVVVDEFKKTFFKTAEGADLEALAVDHFGDSFARPEAVKATGTVTFSRPTNSAGNVTILAGTVVKTKQNAAGRSQRFEVVSTVVLTNLTINASVRALVAGTDGNVLANTVTEIETSLTDSTVTVNNGSAFGGGEAQEDDSTYRETIRNLIQTITGATSAAIKAKALTVGGVVNATVVEVLQYVKEWDIGGNATVGDYFAIARPYLYIADANGTASDALVNDAKSAIESVRACGPQVQVVAAQAVTINWTASLTLNPSGPNYATLLSDTTMVEDVMKQYIQDLPIGTNFSRALGRAYIMSKFGPAGTNDLTDFVTSVPTGDVAITSTQKPIPGTMSA